MHTPLAMTADSVPLQRRLIVGILLVALFAIAVVILSLVHSRNQHEQKAGIATENMAWALSAQIKESLAKVDNSLLVLVDEYQSQDASGNINEHGLNELIAC